MRQAGGNGVALTCAATGSPAGRGGGRLGERYLTERGEGRGRGSFLGETLALEVRGLAARESFGGRLWKELQYPTRQHGRARSGLGFASNSADVIIRICGMRNCSIESALRPCYWKSMSVFPPEETSEKAAHFFSHGLGLGLRYICP